MGSVNEAARSRVLGALKAKIATTTTVGLRRRVAVLEAEVQECRAVNLRVAELVDIVTELLVPLAREDGEALQTVLERYHESL